MNNPFNKQPIKNAPNVKKHNLNNFREQLGNQLLGNEFYEYNSEIKTLPPKKFDNIENSQDKSDMKNKIYRKQDNENVSVSEDNCQSIESKSIKVESHINTCEDKIENFLKNDLSKENISSKTDYSDLKKILEDLKKEIELNKKDKANLEMCLDTEKKKNKLYEVEISELRNTVKEIRLKDLCEDQKMLKLEISNLNNILNFRNREIEIIKEDNLKLKEELTKFDIYIKQYKVIENSHISNFNHIEDKTNQLQMMVTQEIKNEVYDNIDLNEIQNDFKFENTNIEEKIYHDINTNTNQIEIASINKNNDENVNTIEDKDDKIIETYDITETYSEIVKLKDEVENNQILNLNSISEFKENILITEIINLETDNIHEEKNNISSTIDKNVLKTNSDLFCEEENNQLINKRPIYKNPPKMTKKDINQAKISNPIKSIDESNIFDNNENTEDLFNMVRKPISLNNKLQTVKPGVNKAPPTKQIIKNQRKNVADLFNFADADDMGDNLFDKLNEKGSSIFD